MLIPRHPLRRSQYRHTTRFGAAQKSGLTLDEPLQRMFSLASCTRAKDLPHTIVVYGLSARKLDSPIFGISLRTLEGALDTCDEIEIAIKRFLGSEFITP